MTSKVVHHTILPSAVAVAIFVSLVDDAAHHASTLTPLFLAALLAYLVYLFRRIHTGT
jgi:hypothetical protein